MIYRGLASRERIFEASRASILGSDRVGKGRGDEDGKKAEMKARMKTIELWIQGELFLVVTVLILTLLLVIP